MIEKQNGKLLRIYIGTKDRYKGGPLYEAIVKKAKELGLAGVTVIRGIEGFGATSREIHRDNILRLSEDLPLLIEIVDMEEKIRVTIPEFEEMLDSGKHGALVTLGDVEIIRNK